MAVAAEANEKGSVKGMANANTMRPMALQAGLVQARAKRKAEASVQAKVRALATQPRLQSSNVSKKATPQHSLHRRELIKQAPWSPSFFVAEPRHPETSKPQSAATSFSRRSGRRSLQASCPTF